MPRLASTLLLMLPLFGPCAVLAQSASPLSTVLQTYENDLHGDLSAVVVLRDGALVAEHYYNGETADTLHDIRSAGKSITALLVGAAVARGQLQTSGTVGQYWPEVAGSPAGKVALDDVLTMRSGLAAFDEDANSPGNEDKLDEAADPTKFVRGVPSNVTPGSVYRYNSLTAYIAGRVVESASGADLETFAAKNLFTPLGIARWSWGRDSAGHPKGQGNLSLRARDTAKIGQMVLDEGRFEGRRVIEASWIKAALAPRVATGEADRYADHYGYFWYAKTQEIAGEKIPVFFASGNGGNKIYVIPTRRMVVSIASSAYGKGYGQRRSEDILKALLQAEKAR
ncbi:MULTISPECIES: serine hydrolase [unclassified Janthinobacterium]|uniref:serine hydrolase domain-containing protein n=1 Tax=unclassified Janthinobacterium TaxID=2610881 RepID=UPI001827D25E|nr:MULTISPECIES: serine hydrolase [unclassified Janthinobacterium]MBB5368822.1 CubicO group peptidase (beta-lactamase class C family) [Janthinobacterium sp. K2C7]MBB5381642.1 CubicO group peptidase (beta-lactamase class C family) [Janthinobacterium sp. K2Li3]MBB5387204.1 CubicO group peptidase (beta-lactamase class C family) [Janthinobacterium sp. K2E3]